MKHALKIKMKMFAVVIFAIVYRFLDIAGLGEAKGLIIVN
jgi:hypothetical protein